MVAHLLSIIALALLTAERTNECVPVFDKYEWTFAACVWSAQECAYSCANPNIFKVLEDSALCYEPDFGLACYCGTKI